MMTQGNRSLQVSGSKVAPNVQMDVNAPNALQHLKQELHTCQMENKKLTDQLNCLVSLIKRSWCGDRHATIHLSNIIGLEPPQQMPISDGSIARPNSQMNPTPSSKTRCERNWERLAMKLLEREYQAVQQEIREYQQRYIENRQAYMDAVLQDHHESMTKVPLHRKANSFQTLEELDSKFIQHSKALKRMGTNVGSHFRRVQSAGQRRRVPIHEVVEQAEVSLRELVGETPSSNHFRTGQTMSEPRTITPSAYVKRRPVSSVLPRHPPPNTYNDPERYAQRDLYRPNESDGLKRPRPVSASSLKEGDIIRSRPRSGRTNSASKEQQAEKTVFITQTNERPLKYETTRPVSSKPKSAKQRRNSTGGAVKKSGSEHKVLIRPQTDVISASSKALASSASMEGGHPGDLINHVEQPQADVAGTDSEHYDMRGEELQDSDYEDFDMSTKPPVAVRVKSAFTRRPAFIDEFSRDEQTMREMEEDFKKTALSLQKKLGITDAGMVTYD